MALYGYICFVAVCVKYKYPSRTIAIDKMHQQPVPVVQAHNFC